jgi:hypothetical protein
MIIATNLNAGKLLGEVSAISLELSPRETRLGRVLWINS